MILESTVIVSSWLKDPVHGVNAMLGKVPRGKMGSGTFPAPAKVTVYDDIQDESVAMELDPDKVPAVVVFADSDINVSMDWGDIGPLKGTALTIAASYIYRDVPALVARRDGMFVLRAIQWSLRRFNSNRYSEGKRRLNDISVSGIRATRQQRVTGAVGRSTLAGFVLANLDVVDHSTP